MDKTIIKPTVGRVVLYVPSAGEDCRSSNEGHCAAIITDVFNDRCISLCAFSAGGSTPYPRNSVQLLQDGDLPIPGSPTGYAKWMPYQTGQAQKTEAIQREIDRREKELGLK
jgi:hypothetical protein